MKIDLTNAKNRLCKEYKTVSGLEIPDRWITWFELYRDDFIEELEKFGFGDEAKFDRLILEMNEFDNVGSFLDEYELQRAELAAFGLILFDRILRAESTSVNHADLFAMHEALVECRRNITRSFFKRSDATANARKRHAETTDLKNEIFQWLGNKNGIFESEDRAAAEIMKQVPIKHSTAKRWFQEWKKLC